MPTPPWQMPAALALPDGAVIAKLLASDGVTVETFRWPDWFTGAKSHSGQAYGPSSCCGTSTCGIQIPKATRI